jgi:hypothetical protein
MMVANDFFETLVSTHQITKRHIIEDRNLDVKQEVLGRIISLLSSDAT